MYFGGKRVARIDVPTPLTVKYYFSDQLGSADVITDATGNILEESDYFPYGGEITITNNDGNNYKFTGKERDPETCTTACLDYFGARHYTSSLGRFMVPDWAVKPVSVPFANLGSPQSLNLYSYVENNPLTLVDADGHELTVAADLQGTVDTMRSQSSSFESELHAYQGSNSPNLSIQFGATPADPSGVPSIGNTDVGLVPNLVPSTVDITGDLGSLNFSYGDNVSYSLPTDSTPSTTITVSKTISSNSGQVSDVLAHEVGHAHDARTNTDRYGHDSQRTKDTKGKTPHDARPEEKRANDFKRKVQEEIKRSKKGYKEHEKKDK